MNIPEGYRPWHEFMNVEKCLIWDQYGYWQKPQEHFRPRPPDWFTPEEINRSKEFAATLKEPEIRLVFEVSEDGRHGHWATVDDANQIVYFENRVGPNPDSLGKFSAELYMRGRHAEHERLYGGVIRALLVYQQTGIACLPDWNTNKIDSYGYKNGKTYTIPRAKEVKV